MMLCRKWSRRFSNHGVLRFFSKSAIDEFNEELAETFGSTPPVTLGESGLQEKIDNKSVVPRIHSTNDRFPKIENDVPLQKCIATTDTSTKSLGNNEEFARIEMDRESR